MLLCWGKDQVAPTQTGSMVTTLLPAGVGGRKCSLPSESQSGAQVPVVDRGTTENDQVRDIEPREPLRKTSEGQHNETGTQNSSLTVFALDQARWATIKEAQRGLKVTIFAGAACGGEEARSQTVVMIKWIQQLVGWYRGHCLHFGNGSRVYRRLRNSEGPHLDQPTLARTCDQCETAAENGQRGGIHPQHSGLSEPAHRTQKPNTKVQKVKNEGVKIGPQ